PALACIRWGYVSTTPPLPCLGGGAGGTKTATASTNCRFATSFWVPFGVQRQARISLWQAQTHPWDRRAPCAKHGRQARSDHVSGNFGERVPLYTASTRTGSVPHAGRFTRRHAPTSLEL